MSTSKMDLSGKVVVVTGASMGIGEGDCQSFCRQGRQRSPVIAGRRAR
jgi:NAD(P)-dependent dehydrogenase (short-subunit alcohol dehydrogenase family)